MVTKIETKKAPSAIGPYSQAVMVDKMLFISGQIPINSETGLIESGIENQTHQVFKNIEAILKEVGLNFANIVKTTVYLKDLNDFQRMNEIYSAYINGPVLPARCAVQVVALPKNSLIEIECIAYKE